DPDVGAADGRPGLPDGPRTRRAVVSVGPPERPAGRRAREAVRHGGDALADGARGVGAARRALSGPGSPAPEVTPRKSRPGGRTLRRARLGDPATQAGR